MVVCDRCGSPGAVRLSVSFGGGYPHNDLVNHKVDSCRNCMDAIKESLDEAIKDTIDLHIQKHLVRTGE